MNKEVKEIEKFVLLENKKAMFELREAQKMAKHSKRLNDKHQYWQGKVNALNQVETVIHRVKLKAKGLL
tara:strand:- start:192 stop:398 length:207 start_codon:yes stop_codon:yes gene_type:complete